MLPMINLQLQSTFYFLFFRLTRRTTGRKLSRIGLDNDLRVLTEWTGNLAAAIEETSPCKKNTGSGDAGRGDLERLGDCEPMDCGELPAKRTGTEEINLTDIEKTVKESKRRSTNQSFTDDLWGNDDWYDDDSFIRIATQVENEALTQQQMQRKTGKSEPADVISPTQMGPGIDKLKKTFASGDKSTHKVDNASRKLQVEPKGQTVSKPPSKYATRNVSHSFVSHTTSHPPTRPSQTVSRPSVPNNSMVCKGSIVLQNLILLVRIVSQVMLQEMQQYHQNTPQQNMPHLLHLSLLQLHL